MTDFPIEQIRKDFPILGQMVYGKPLAYLDNGATTQKPLRMIEATNKIHREQNASIHRSVNFLSDQMTTLYEEARITVQKFIGAPKSSQIIFTSGATGSINLVAFSVGEGMLKPGDEIILSTMEHHSNIVPWQMLAEGIGIKLKVAPINDQGELIMEDFKKLLSDKVKFVSVVHVSNALGTVNPVKEIIHLAHAKGIPVMVDGAQAVAHTPLDVKDLDCDFYAFSGHKLLGPTGIGVLYGKKEFLEKMPPYQGGGDMIRSVTFEKTVYNDLPYKFEAGTPHIAGVIGLGTAIDYIQSVGLERIEAYEQELLSYGTEKLLQVPGLRLIGTTRHKSAILSFVLGEAHAHDIGTILDRQGIAIRAGHHCAMPVMQRFNVPATTRASLAFYNTFEEIDRLVAALHEVTEVFR